jgi:hypothetical protein
MAQYMAQWVGRNRRHCATYTAKHSKALLRATALQRFWKMLAFSIKTCILGAMDCKAGNDNAWKILRLFIAVGIVNAEGDVCCAAECTVCGDFSCDGRVLVSQALGPADETMAPTAVRKTQKKQSRKSRKQLTCLTLQCSPPLYVSRHRQLRQRQHQLQERAVAVPRMCVTRALFVALTRRRHASLLQVNCPDSHCLCLITSRLRLASDESIMACLVCAHRLQVAKC